MYFEIKIESLPKNNFIDIMYLIDGECLLSSRHNRKFRDDTDMVNVISYEFYQLIKYESQSRINRNGMTRRNYKIPQRHQGSIEIFITGEFTVPDDELIALFRLQQASNGIVYVSRIE